MQRDYRDQLLKISQKNWAFEYNMNEIEYFGRIFFASLRRKS